MRLSLALALMLGVRLAVATMAAAQTADDEPPPPAIPPRFEIGGVAGLTIAFPEVGVLASVPTGPGSAIEVAVGWLPGVVYEVEHMVAQAQFRMPFHPHLRSRRSLVVGVTRLSARRRNSYDSASGATTPPRPFPMPASACSGRWGATPISASTPRACSPSTASCRWCRAPPRRSCGTRAARDEGAPRAGGTARDAAHVRRRSVGARGTGHRWTRSAAPRDRRHGGSDLHIPTVGVLASVPASGRTSAEGGVNLTPHERIVQGQLRVPFGSGSGSRRSVVVGLSHVAHRAGTEGALETGLAAHGGMSAQAPLSRRFDLRADVQVIVPFRDGPGADLRAAVGFVWHR